MAINNIYYIIIDEDGETLSDEEEMDNYLAEQVIYPESKIMKVVFKPNIKFTPAKLEKI